MTVSSSTNRDDYAGNGSTTSFAVSFRFLENSHIKATLRDALSTETLQVETTDYTLTGAGGAGGGTLVMIVAPPSGTTLTIQRDVPATQETDYVENDEFPAESHEDALDKLTMLVQQQGEDSTRHIGFSDTVSDATGSAVELSQDATQRADKFLGFDSAGNIVTKTASVAGLVDQGQQDKRYSPIVATVTAMEAANPVALDGVIFVPVIGMVIGIVDYATGNSSGFMTGTVVAAATGTADGGTFIDLANGTQWKQGFAASPTGKQYGAVADGVADDAASILAIDTVGDFKLTAGTYRISTNTTLVSNIVFDPGAKFSVDTGVTLTLRQIPKADQFQSIFEGLGTYALEGGQSKWSVASADWFGAATGDATLGVEAALVFSDNILMQSAAYSITTQLDIPDSRFMTITGAGFRTTVLTVAAGITGIKYARTEDATGSILTLDGLQLTESGLAKTGFGISFAGFAAGAAGSETKIQADNFLRVKNCTFSGFARGIDTHHAGQCHFENNFYQANTAAHFMQRNSSFFYFTNCMSLSNANFILAQDSIADALSNGMEIVNCNSVTCSDVDVNVQGWQAVFIRNGGYDLGTGGVAALFFDACQDVRIAGSWVASDLAATTRDGVIFQGSRNSSVTESTLVNNERAVNLVTSSGISVSDNTFEGNTANDVFAGGTVTGVTITDNKHRTDITIATTDAPVYANVAGNDYFIINDNIFKNASFTMTIPGGNTTQTGNLFSWPA